MSARLPWIAMSFFLTFVLHCLICVPAVAGALAAVATMDLPWFDVERDTLGPPGTSSLTPPAPRLAEPKSPRDWTWDSPDFSANRGWNFSGFGDVLASWLQIAAWVLLVVAALWFVVFVLRSYRDLELGKRPDTDKRPLDRTIDVEKLADLPFESPEANGDLLSAIRQKVEQGKHGEATVLLFGYQLLKLDKSQIIHILKGKTNRQYVREVGRHEGQSRLRDMLTQTMVTFEDYFFGNHPVTREKFEACFGLLEEFHSIVEAAA